MKRNFPRHSLLFVCVSAVLISLSPYMLNGFWGDDAIHHSIWGTIQLSGLTFFQFIWKESIRWIHMDGRFFPIGLLQTYGAFYLIHDVRIFRVAHVLWTCVHVATFVWLLRRLKLSWEFIGLWLLCLVGSFQIREYHDPLAAAGFFLQSQGILFTLAILCVITWDESRQLRWLLFAVICTSISLLMYELNYIFFPTALGLLYVSNQTIQTKFRAAVVLFSPLIFFIPFTLYIRSNANHIYDGIQLGHASLAPITYLKQLVSAFPGSYYVLHWHDDFSFGRLVAEVITNPLPLLLFFTASLSVFYCLSACKSIWQPPSRNTGELKVIAISLAALPPIFMAISGRYQVELTWGLGYLPVYYSYFGVSLLLAIFLIWIAKQSRLLKWTITIAIGFLLAANLVINSSVSAKMDKAHSLEQKLSLELALKSGLLDQVQDNDILLLHDMPADINEAFFYQHSGKRIHIEDAQGSDTASLLRSKRYSLNSRSQYPQWVISESKVQLIFGKEWSGGGAMNQFATITLYNHSIELKQVIISFEMSTLKPRKVQIKFNTNSLITINLKPGEHKILGPFAVDLQSANNLLSFDSDVAADFPGNGDPRKLAFGVANLNVKASCSTMLEICDDSFNANSF